MHSKVGIPRRRDELRGQYGEWTYDLPLPIDIWTKGNQKIPHTRLKRIVQTVSDLVCKPFSEFRILDLACLDGTSSIEFATQEATTSLKIGVARYCRKQAKEAANSR